MWLSRASPPLCIAAHSALHCGNRRDWLGVQPHSSTPSRHRNLLWEASGPAHCARAVCRLAVCECEGLCSEGGRRSCLSRSSSDWSSLVDDSRCSVQLRCFPPCCSPASLDCPLVPSTSLDALCIHSQLASDPGARFSNMEPHGSSAASKHPQRLQLDLRRERRLQKHRQRRPQQLQAQQRPRRPPLRPLLLLQRARPSMWCCLIRRCSLKEVVSPLTLVPSR